LENYGLFWKKNIYLNIGEPHLDGLRTTRSQNQQFSSQAPNDLKKQASQFVHEKEGNYQNFQ
jgi:hypothetical protein